MQHSKIMGSKSLAEHKSTQIHSGSLLGSQQDPWDATQPGFSFIHAIRQLPLELTM